ncbi:protein FAM187B-like [Lepus europaeus]|uniref:protein FAM187B-like n=1 Tax=Lepus europaeus TaxID=9983 RepID=UPI002B491D93|nr:protein FAM187B-like [Lepus europaeus]
MMASLWLVSLSFPSLWAQALISCSYKSLCQRALLSGNEAVLQCDHPGAVWHFTSFLEDTPSLLHSTANVRKFPGGSLQLSHPQPAQTGLYSCQDPKGSLVVEYEIDFQDVTTLHVTHRDLGQEPLPNETLNLGGAVLVYTRWEPWQDCNRCGGPGERKRLGFCYVEDSPEESMPCWLYLRELQAPYGRMQPELQVEACLVPCDGASTKTTQPYFIFDAHQLGEWTSHVWLTCPFASVYR